MSENLAEQVIRPSYEQIVGSIRHSLMEITKAKPRRRSPWKWLTERGRRYLGQPRGQAVGIEHYRHHALGELDPLAKEE
jgi:hypothetical protein